MATKTTTLSPAARERLKTLGAGLPSYTRFRVYWIPQVPMKPYYVEVDSPEEAALLLITLADYDKFQYENKIKPDYCNTGGLQIWDADEKEWLDWTDDDTGDDIRTYMEGK